MTAVLLLALALVLGIQAWRLFPGEFFAEQARAALRDRRPFAALSFARRGLAFEKENPQLYYYLGRSRFLTGEREVDPRARASFSLAALPAYETARQLSPLDETYPLELALTYDSLGRFPEAEWMFDKAHELDPNSDALQHYYEGHIEQWRRHGTAAETRPAPVEPRG